MDDDGWIVSFSESSEHLFYYPPFLSSLDSALAFWSTVEVPLGALNRLAGHIRVGRSADTEIKAFKEASRVEEEWIKQNPRPNYLDEEEVWKKRANEVFKSEQDRQRESRSSGAVTEIPDYAVRPLARMIRMLYTDYGLSPDDRPFLLKAVVPIGDDHKTVAEWMTTYRVSKKTADCLNPTKKSE